MSRNPRRVADRIQDMLEAIANIRSDVGDMNRETHEYFRADAGIVWTTIKNSLPVLEAELGTYVSEG